jgi:transposase-like protein
MAASKHGRRYEAESMRGWFEEARARGWSQARLGRQSGISVPTLARWRRRLESSAGELPGFVELTHLVPGPSAGGDALAEIEVVLRSGHRLRVGRGVDEATLRRVVAVLDPRC